MDDAVYQCDGLSERDIAFLHKMQWDMGILADIHRADVLIYCRLNPEQAVVVAEARPHSVSPVHREPIIGTKVLLRDETLIQRALERGWHGIGDVGGIAGGAPIVREVHPMRNSLGKPIAALSVEMNTLEYERHRRRSKVFRRAVRWLLGMVLRGELQGAEELSPFGEHDGIMIVDMQRRIQYLSGIANHQYRKLGYMESLLKRRVSSLETQDDRLVSLVLSERRCVEQEVLEQRRVWVKKAIPLISRDDVFNWPRKYMFLPLRPPRLMGVMLTTHDATETRLRERELKVKSAMIQEVHHRVKNNLQTIVALLRMQARRLEPGEARQIIEEGISRILSVAVIHEFLSQDESQVINIREVTQRIINQMQQGVLGPDKRIRLRLQGPSVYLRTQQATSCALIINELLQNAVEHGYRRRSAGTVTVILEDEGDRVAVRICDDGGGLPADFDLDRGSSLGLQIVKTLVRDDLKGEFELQGGKGVSATVRFPKQISGGEGNWNEPG